MRCGVLVSYVSLATRLENLVVCDEGGWDAILCLWSSKSFMISSTISTLAFRLRCDSRIFSGLPPRSVMKSLLFYPAVSILHMFFAFGP